MGHRAIGKDASPGPAPPPLFDSPPSSSSSVSLDSTDGQYAPPRRKRVSFNLRVTSSPPKLTHPILPKRKLSDTAAKIKLSKPKTAIKRRRVNQNTNTNVTPADTHIPTVNNSESGTSEMSYPDVKGIAQILGDIMLLFECPLCKEILEEPVKAVCGHRLCRGCMIQCFVEASMRDKVSREQAIPSCPVSGCNSTFKWQSYNAEMKLTKLIQATINVKRAFKRETKGCVPIDTSTTRQNNSQLNSSSDSCKCQTMAKNGTDRVIQANGITITIPHNSAMIDSWSNSTQVC